MTPERTGRTWAIRAGIVLLAVFGMAVWEAWHG